MITAKDTFKYQSHSNLALSHQEVMFEKTSMYFWFCLCHFFSDQKAEEIEEETFLSFKKLTQNYWASLTCKVTHERFFSRVLSPKIRMAISLNYVPHCVESLTRPCGQHDEHVSFKGHTNCAKKFEQHADKRHPWKYGIMLISYARNFSFGSI